MMAHAHCLFVGDMSVCLREKQLTDLFQQFGKVLHIEVRKSKEEFKFQGYGFVTMATLEEAQSAMAGLNGLMVSGRKLRLNWANTEEVLKSEMCAEVAFNFISKQISRLVCEETIRELFSQYNCEVVDVKIKQYKIDETRQQQHGLGFVHYPLTTAGVLAVKRALHHLGCVSVEDISLDTGMSVTLEKILKERPDLDIPYIPEGHTVEPVYSSATRKFKTGVSRQMLYISHNLPFATLSSVEHFIERPLMPPVQTASLNKVAQSNYMHSGSGSPVVSGYRSVMTGPPHPPVVSPMMQHQNQQQAMHANRHYHPQQQQQSPMYLADQQRAKPSQGRGPPLLHDPNGNYNPVQREQMGAQEWPAPRGGVGSFSPHQSPSHFQQQQQQQPRPRSFDRPQQEQFQQLHQSQQMSMSMSPSHMLNQHRFAPPVQEQQQQFHDHPNRLPQQQQHQMFAPFSTQQNNNIHLQQQQPFAGLYGQSPTHQQQQQYSLMSEERRVLLREQEAQRKLLEIREKHLQAEARREKYEQQKLIQRRELQQQQTSSSSFDHQMYLQEHMGQYHQQQQQQQQSANRPISGIQQQQPPRDVETRSFNRPAPLSFAGHSMISALRGPANRVTPPGGGGSGGGGHSYEFELLDSITPRAHGHHNLITSSRSSDSYAMHGVSSDTNHHHQQQQQQSLIDISGLTSGVGGGGGLSLNPAGGLAAREWSEAFGGNDDDANNNQYF